MWAISKSEVADLLRLDLMARLREAKEKEALYRRTHQQSFEAFEQTVQQGEEDFERWDDPDSCRDGRRIGGFGTTSNRK